MTAWLRQDNRWIPGLFVGGFAVVLAVNAVMIWLAVGTFGGLATSDYYDRGRTYNETLATAEEIAQTGWTSEASETALGDGAYLIEVTLGNAAGDPLVGATIEGRLIRPAEADDDFDVVFVAAGEGLWTAEVSPPAPGLWDLRLIARRDGMALATEHRLVLTP